MILPNMLIMKALLPSTCGAPHPFGPGNDMTRGAPTISLVMCGHRSRRWLPLQGINSDMILLYRALVGLGNG